MSETAHRLSRRVFGRVAVLALAFALLLCPLALSVPSAQAARPVQPEPEELVAVVPADLPPMHSTLPDGTPTGFAVEVMNRVAEGAGYRVRYITTTVGEDAQRELLAGRAQVLPGLAVVDKRQEHFAFTTPMEMVPVHIYFRAEGRRFETLEDLKGRRVLLVAGSVAEEMLAGDRSFERHMDSTRLEALFARFSGESDALVYPAPIAEYAARSAGMKQMLGRSARPLFEVGRGIAVRRDQVVLLGRLEKSLEEFRDTKEFRELYRKWHTPPPPDALFPSWVLWSLVGLAVAIMAALLAWRSFSLLGMNRRLTRVLAERDQALADLRLPTERLEALATLSGMETEDTDALIRFALEEGVRLTGSQMGYLFFVEGDSIDLRRLHWSSGVDALCQIPRDAIYPLGEGGVWTECLRTRVPAIINDYASHPGRRGLPEGHAPLLRHMAVPLVEGERVMAVFGVGNKATDYDGNDTRQLQLFLMGLWRVLQARRDAEAIRQARDYAENLIHGANAMIVGLDPQGRVTMFNAAAEAVTGYSRAEVLGRYLWDVLVPPESAEMVRDRFRRYMEGLMPLPLQHEGVLGTRGGSVRSISWQNSLLKDGETITGIIAFGIDTTERKAAEAELRRLLHAIEQAAEGVLITDAQGRVTFVNQAFERLTGLPRERLMLAGGSVLDLGVSVLEHQSSQVHVGEVPGTWRGTCSFIREDGPPTEVEFTVSSICGGDERPTNYVAVCRDVTEKRLLEHQLWQAQKMEALGTLAGGIAHDFNNILASIMGFAELAMDDMPPQSRSRGCLARVLKASVRARELVRQILSFSRRDERKLGLLRAEAVVDEALKLLRASLPKEIEVRSRLAATSCTILADPSQIHQIVMNLCTNSAQAMRATGGRLTVSTASEQLAPELAVRHRIAAGEYLRICVEDEGPGIEPEVLGRIFDPFFTTKGPGEGTGLGLAVVHGIVASLGGVVYAESEVGHGARLSVLLPAQAAEPEPVSQRLDPGPAGQGHILLVDDEPDLLDLGRQTLEPLGYQITALSDPEAALAALSARPHSVDLVVTDQSMPRLTGLTLAERLREARSDLPIIISTGFSKAIPQDRLQALGAVWLLPKPFSNSELAQAVRRALTGA